MAALTPGDLVADILVDKRFKEGGLPSARLADHICVEQTIGLLDAKQSQIVAKIEATDVADIGRCGSFHEYDDGRYVEILGDVQIG